MTGTLPTRFRPAILALTALLGACAAPQPPPLLSLNGLTCAAQPDFIGATPVLLDAGKTVRIDLDGAVPCFLAPGGARSSYAAFAVPDSPTEFIASVTSWQRGQGLLSPHIFVYDPLGRFLREVPGDAFQFHGPSLHAGLRIHPGERYIVVASDPQSLGRQITQIVDATNSSTATAIAARGASAQFTYHYGTETENAVVFSYNGAVSATALSVPVIP